MAGFLTSELSSESSESESLETFLTGFLVSLAATIGAFFPVILIDSEEESSSLSEEAAFFALPFLGWTSAFLATPLAGTFFLSEDESLSSLSSEEVSGFFYAGFLA